MFYLEKDKSLFENKAWNGMLKKTASRNFTERKNSTFHVTMRKGKFLTNDKRYQL